MDLIKDIEERLLAARIRPAERMLRVLEEVRRDWGGENCYIPKNGEPPRQTISRRNAALIRDWQRGERVLYLARKYGISVKRVYAVLKMSRPSLSGETRTMTECPAHDPDS